jgi:hypothetical protein
MHAIPTILEGAFLSGQNRAVNKVRVNSNADRNSESGSFRLLEFVIMLQT